MDNAGYDSSELLANLRAAHSKGDSTAGLGVCVCACGTCACVFYVCIVIYWKGSMEFSSHRDFVTPNVSAADCCLRQWYDYKECVCC